MSGPVRFLYLEDHADSRHAFSRLLSKRSLDLRVVGTVREAMEQFDWKPQILLLDLMLPDGDGLQVALTARQRGLNSSIAFLTAAMRPPVADAAPLNVTWFQKPTDAYHVLAWVDTAIQKAIADEAQASATAPR